VYRKLNPNVLMMKSTQDSERTQEAGSLNRTRDRRILVQRPMRSVVVLYNGTRTDLSLNKDAPISRAAEAAGRILSRPILGGLHHQYARA
jgi:hypothetical protein